MAVDMEKHMMKMMAAGREGLYLIQTEDKSVPPLTKETKQDWWCPTCRARNYQDCQQSCHCPAVSIVPLQ